VFFYSIWALSKGAFEFVCCTVASSQNNHHLQLQSTKDTSAYFRSHQTDSPNRSQKQLNEPTSNIMQKTHPDTISDERIHMELWRLFCSETRKTWEILNKF